MIKQTIKRLLDQALVNEKDSLARGKAQQKRAPFDHDNNESLIKIQERIDDYNAAIWWIEGQ
jgi:hypothetical protein